MQGVVPTSEFLKKVFRPEHYKQNTEYVSKDIEKSLKSKRTWMTYHFIRPPQGFVENEDDDGPSLRSSSQAIEDWVVNPDLADMNCTTERDLSIYPLEQLMLMEDRTRLMLLVNVDDDHNLFGGLGAKINAKQQLEIASISGKKYYRLKCTVIQSNRDELVHGLSNKMYSQALFEGDFQSRNGGFIIQFDGDDKRKQHFNWRDVVDFPSTFKFFGTPLTRSRSFDSIFKNVKSLSTIFHRFKHYYSEFEGDLTACTQLYNSYLHRRNIIFSDTIKKKAKDAKNYDGNLFHTTKVQEFAQLIDEHCRTSLMAVFTEFKNHAEPIISIADMQSFIEQAPGVFGDTWDFFCELRGVKPNHKAEQERNITRIHSVFYDTLAMMRRANRRVLKHWAFIHSTANYARGVGRAAEAAFAYFGHTLSPSGRQSVMNRLMGNDSQGVREDDTLKHKQSKLFRACTALIICYDNYQRGIKLQHQRGQHTGSYFKGTHQCAHSVLIFDDDTFDAFHADFTMFDQALPSPWGMPVFEFLDWDDTANFFVNYDSYQTVTTPEFSGDRVSSYLQLRDLASHLNYMKRAFPDNDSDDEGCFQYCPSEFDMNKLHSFADVCHSDSVKALFKCTKQFQRSTVHRWHPTIDEPTQSIYLGLIGIDESASKECGAITLDLLFRAGVLENDDGGGWALADDWENRRIYLFGDAKTIENMTKFVRDMQDRKISYSMANLQSEIFLQALTRVVEMPGDWHTGLNMLASIYNLYYVGFLDQFQDHLYWKRINKDVSGCYYQAHRLVKFVHDELMRFFMHQFVSERSRTDEDVLLSQPQFICKVASEFMEFMNELKSSGDKWISTCAMFLEMSYDFLEFVEAYRVGDAVSIEYGYQKHSPVWMAVGQHKYVDIFYGQQEALYRDLRFSQLQEIRLNRVVRWYHGKTGKRCVAHDEFLEHGNRFFFNFPLPKTLTSFAFQSNYVGIGLMCKRHTDTWCTSSWKGDVARDYTKSVPPSMTPEKKLLYQVIAKLNTHIVDPRRTKFDKTYVMSVKDALTINLKRTVLENSMKYAPPTSADDILKSVTSVMEEELTAGIDPVEEGELEQHELENIMGNNELATIDEESALPDTRQSFSKKTMHDLFFENPWEIGRGKFAEKDVLRLRDEKVRRLTVKCKVRQCILNDLSELANSAKEIVVGTEMDIRPE